MLAHNVFFTLKDRSHTAAESLVDGCRKYLSGHAGTAFFACGRLAQGLDRAVNDLDFDVALHVIFEDRASHDAYQEAPRHREFIREFQDNWERVRVFDSDCPR